MTRNPKAKRCWVCESLTPLLRRQLDEFITQPALWPEPDQERYGTLGRMPPRSVQIRLGVAWLADHGRADMGAPPVRTHLDHRAAAVPEIDALTAVQQPAGAMALMGFYADAISAGRKALAKLVTRMDDEDDPLSTDELFRLASLGGRYAQSAAQLRVRGQSPLAGDEGFVPPEPPPPEPPPPLPPPPKQVTPPDPLEGFYAGAAPKPSKRVGSVRVRTIEGVARPVRDEGPKDRAHYNRTADQEGSPRL